MAKQTKNMIIISHRGISRDSLSVDDTAVSFVIVVVSVCSSIIVTVDIVVMEVVVSVVELEVVGVDVELVIVVVEVVDDALTDVILMVLVERLDRVNVEDSVPVYVDVVTVV